MAVKISYFHKWNELKYAVMALVMPRHFNDITRNEKRNTTANYELN